jgi:hypothetical protein
MVPGTGSTATLPFTGTHDKNKIVISLNGCDLSPMRSRSANLKAGNESSRQLSIAETWYSESALRGAMPRIAYDGWTLAVGATHQRKQSVAVLGTKPADVTVQSSFHLVISSGSRAV